MAASVTISKTIYCGAFAHCATLSELDICSKGAIGVDEQGVIRFVEKELDVKDVLRKHGGWGDAKVVRVNDGFFFPGFIGELVSS